MSKTLRLFSFFNAGVSFLTSPPAHDIPAGTDDGQRPAVKYGTVIDRNLTDPQPGTDDVLTFGW